MKRVCTIGVYEWDLETFLEALRGAEVRLLLDLASAAASEAGGTYRHGYPRQILHHTAILSDLVDRGLHRRPAGIAGAARWDRDNHSKSGRARRAACCASA